MLGSSNFTKINDSFTCAHCGRGVAPAKATCRNHCPFCLTSRHVDEKPGDRNNSCRGLMDAVSYENSGKKGLILTFRCRRCGFTGRNKAVLEGVQPDSMRAILSLGI